MSLFFDYKKSQVRLSNEAAKLNACANAIFGRALREGPDYDTQNLATLAQLTKTSERIAFEKAVLKPK